MPFPLELFHAMYASLLLESRKNTTVFKYIEISDFDGAYYILGIENNSRLVF